MVLLLDIVDLTSMIDHRCPCVETDFSLPRLLGLPSWVPTNKTILYLVLHPCQCGHMSHVCCVWRPGDGAAGQPPVCSSRHNSVKRRTRGRPQPQRWSWASASGDTGTLTTPASWPRPSGREHPPHLFSSPRDTCDCLEVLSTVVLPLTCTGRPK